MMAPHTPDPPQRGLSAPPILSDEPLPEAITRAASTQTYYIIRFLVDRPRRLDAYRAYAYFRWVDDWLDEQVSSPSARRDFIERQCGLVEACYRGTRPPALSAEEQMAADLIQGDCEPNSGLQSYLRHMLAVLTFDAERQGHLISGTDLARYTEHLSTAVTDALQYFIGHEHVVPQSATRCQAAAAAHITHLLRDTFEDVAAGYYNIPAEFLAAHSIGPGDVHSGPYRMWVKHRVQEARTAFACGEGYLTQLTNLRCRLAGYAYVARFLPVLDAIERDRYWLRTAYPHRQRLRGALRVGWSLVADAGRSLAAP